MAIFLQQLINGVMLGSTYSLVAIGYTLISGFIIGYLGINNSRGEDKLYEEIL